MIPATLTTREYDVLRLLSSGLSDREIADSLVLSVGTVKWYNRQIYNKLGVRNRTEAVTQAQQFGLFDDAASPSPVDSPTRSLNRMPAQVTSFVGRQHELDDLKRLLQGSRLITLTGPPGTGKTRLAIETGASLSQSAMYPDGVYMISLAPLREAGLVINSIAQALEVKESRAESLNVLLQAHLSDKRLLLILDNFEHVLTAAPLVSELLAAAPNLTILVTSREILRLYGEYEFPVPALQLPDLRQPLSVNDLRSHEAIELFVQRAQATSPNFALDDDNANAVATICVHLDGLPLAIELAAARIKFYAPRTLLLRLSSRLEALHEGPRDLPSRQRTLRSTIAWSYDLLDEEERTLFARLGFFVGGWTIEDAEGICGDGLKTPVSVGLESLLNKSLLRQKASAQLESQDYFMLETIREYALEKLDERGETAIIGEKHCRYYFAMTLQAAQEYYGAQESHWLSRLEAQHDNLRVALQWSLANDPGGQTGLQFIRHLARMWEVKGYFSEGRSWLTQALTLPGAEAPTKARADALLGVGDLTYLQSDYETTRDLYAEALAIYRTLDDQPGIAHALVGLGETATEVGDYDTAPKLYQEAYTIMRALDDVRGCARALTQLGWSALRTGDLKQAREWLEKGLSSYQSIDDRVGVALTYSGIGEVAIRNGDLDEASVALETSLKIRRELGMKWGIAASLGSLAWVAMRQHDFVRAVNILHESFLIRQEIGDKGGMAWCLEKLAEIAQYEQDAEHAVRHFAHAAAIRKSANSIVDPIDQPRYEQMIDQLQVELGVEKFHAIWTTAQTSYLDD
jgi:predicted ATPase/DNA-binding CsgD family transcriptional regulator